MTYEEQVAASVKESLKFIRDLRECILSVKELSNDLQIALMDDVYMQIVTDIRCAEMLCDGNFTLYSAMLLSRNGWCFPCIDTPVLSKTINGHECTIYWFSKGVSSVVIDNDYKCFSKWVRRNSAIIHCNSLQFILNSTY